MTESLNPSPSREDIDREARQIHTDYRTMYVLSQGKDSEADQVREAIENNPELSNFGLLDKLQSVSREAGYDAAQMQLALEQGKLHFEENREVYHDLAVEGAREEGVQINIQQPNEAAYQVPVQKIKE